MVHQPTKNAPAVHDGSYGTGQDVATATLADRPIICPAWCRNDHTDPDNQSITEDGHVEHHTSVWGGILHEARHYGEQLIPGRGGLDLSIERVDEIHGRHGLTEIKLGHATTGGGEGLVLTVGEARELAAALIRAADAAAAYSV